MHKKLDMQLGVTRSAKPGVLLELGRVVASRVDPSVLVILALPLLLLSSRTDWIFDHVKFVGIGYIDSWCYLGFFLNLAEHLQAFPTTYYGSRLSWILPGYAAYKIFAPLVAAYVLHFGLYYAAVFSLYLVLKNSVGRRAALFSAILMGCYSHFLVAMGWDYVDGAGITYFLLTTLALTSSARGQRWWVWLTLGGALYGAMIYSQLFLVVFTPSLLLYGVSLDREHRCHSAALVLSSFAIGFLAVTAFLGGINYRLTGNFLFYWPSVNVASGLVRKPNPWKLPFHIWANRATWLVFPSLTLFSSFVSLFLACRMRSDRRTRFLILSQVCFLACAVILLIFQLTGNPVFQFWYYASLLIPSMFLAVGAQLAVVLDRLSSRHFVLLVYGAIVILLWMYNFPIKPHSAQWVRTHAPLLLIALVLTAVVVLFLKRLSATAFPMLLVCLAFGLLNVANPLFRASNHGAQRHGFLAIVQSVRAIQSVDPTGKLLFWYQLDEPMGNLYRAVASTYLWSYRLINERFPVLRPGEDTFQFPKSGMRLVVISNANDAFQKADSTLAEIGLGAKLIAERTIQDGPIGWRMVFIEVHSWPIIEDVRLSTYGWPESVRLRWESQERQILSLSGREVHELFRSEMDTTADWAINRYGKSGGLSVQPNCLAVGDSCGLYSSGDERDHLASPFAETASKGVVFFSLWVKALRVGQLPTVFVQDERYSTVAVGRELLRRPDGWVLLGGLLPEVPQRQKIREEIIQETKAASLLDKALLVEIPAQFPTLSAVAQQRATRRR